MTTSNEAAKPNPMLQRFQMLIGVWKTTGTHPYLPGIVLHGQTSFQWMEGGAFVIMHSAVEEKEIPSGIAVFGSDDTTQEFFMLYFDERNVSRKYDVSFDNNVLSWHRTSPEFSQRFTFRISEDGQTINGEGEMKRGGLDWEKDLAQIFTRVG